MQIIERACSEPLRDKPSRRARVTNGNADPDGLSQSLAGDYTRLNGSLGEGTDAMTNSIPNTFTGKRDRARFLLRTVGYGVPSLTRAVECFNNRVTLVAECDLQPFRFDGEEVIFNEMHIHTMPWAEALLSANPFERVRMRVTLSYFIEPNPGNRGYTSSYRYSGCGLRFRISSTGQSVGDLEADVSKIAADDATTQGRIVIAGSSDGWLLGDQSFKGSVHSDMWEGSCADALSMKHIAVYPITGWWRTRRASTERPRTSNTFLS